ncbi:MAG: sulfite exporter TauE/SafE family protein [Pseudomonadota bacterium]
MESHDLIIAILVFVAAVLYSSVGHAGASGYLAAMALASLPPAEMRPTALALNVLVAVIATYRFSSIGAFSHRLFWPLCISSMPLAYLGGTITLPGHFYKPVIGLVLLYAAWKSFQTAASAGSVETRPVAKPVLLVVGGVLGFLSGITGVGGGIFLSPVLILCRWANTKEASGVAAAFILVNSAAGLLGVFSTSQTLPSAFPFWAIAAMFGGIIGAEYGSRRLGNPSIQRLLSLVLLIAGLKMLLTAAQ